MKKILFSKNRKTRSKTIGVQSMGIFIIYPSRFFLDPPSHLSLIALCSLGGHISEDIATFSAYLDL